MLSQTSHLQRLYERCLDWLHKGPHSRLLHRPGPRVQHVRVDLVGDDSGHEPTANVNAPLSTDHPFRSKLTNAQRPLVKAWAFNQTVLLRPRHRSSSLLLWTAVGSVAAVSVWAISAPLAETIAVQGKLEPGSSTQRIDTPVPGVVDAVLVQEGQQVRKGDPLVRFDLREPLSKLAAAKSVRDQLVNDNQITAATLGDATITAGLSANQRRQLRSQAEEFTSRRRVAEEELNKARTRLAGARANLSTARNIAQRYEGLVAKGAASEVQLLEFRQRLQDAITQMGEDSREVARLQASLANTGASSTVELRRRMEENLRQISELDRDIRLARQQIQYGELVAPTDGVVFDLEVSAGSVVGQGTGNSASTANKPLLKIVPQDALQARVYLPNSAVGFVRRGQQAELSIAAFPSSDFGTIPAQVLRIGSDALSDDEQKRALGTDATGLYYPAVLHLKQQTIRLSSKTAPLQAGMSITADIKLRERRIINVVTGFLEDQRRNLERLR